MTSGEWKNSEIYALKSANRCRGKAIITAKIGGGLAIFVFFFSLYWATMFVALSLWIILWYEIDRVNQKKFAKKCRFEGDILRQREYDEAELAHQRAVELSGPKAVEVLRKVK